MSYELIVIGGGPGGYAAALYAAKNGLNTALVERDRLGGTCLQRGCVPTKSYLHDAGEGADWRAMLARKNETVNTLTDGISQLMKSGRVDVYAGMGTLQSAAAPFEVLVTPPEGEARVIEGERVLLATGGAPARLPVPGCDDPAVWTSDDLLGEAAAEPFSSLVIIGGGVIGVEMACVCARMGVKVTIVEAEKNCLPMMDKELSRGAEALLRGMGVSLITGARLQQVKNRGDSFSVLAEKDGPVELSCERVLLATGRRPMAEGLFGPGVEVRMERGATMVDGRFETSVPGVFAIGDLNGQCQLAHAAHAQGLAAVSHMLGKQPPVDTALVPSCVYTTPEIACVGMTLEEAKASGVEAIACKALTTQNARTLIEGLGRGFVKLIFDKKSRALLGAQLLCGRASDLLGELSLAIQCGVTAQRLRYVMRGHPTFEEAIAEAVEKALE